MWTFAAVGIIVLVALLRYMHLGFPLERDEGEFGYIAQEILRGVPIYESAYTQKLPGTYLLYALFLSLFGQSIAAIHIGLLLVNAVTMGLIFLILRKTHNALAGFVGAAVFGLMAMSTTVFGFAGHATFFVALFAVGGLYALVRARERGHPALFFSSGLCFGCSFLMKQSAIFFAPLAVVLLAADHLVLTPRRPRRFLFQALVLVAGSLAPLLATIAYYMAIGKFDLFWFWTVQIAREFSEQVSRTGAVANFRHQTRYVMNGFEIIWALALAGLVLTLRDKGLGRSRFLYASFACAGALSVVPGFYFSPHYYISLLPGVALLVGALCGGLARGGGLSGGRMATAGIAWALTGIGLIAGVARHDAYYLGSVSDSVIARQVYGQNPFPESIEIGEYLRRHTAPEDRIGILGSETQILFYAQRRSASRFVNTYYLTADHPRNRAMQQEMIRDIERARPKYLVFVSLASSWNMGPKAPDDILVWANKYNKNYELEGIWEPSDDVLRWGAEARAQPKTPDKIEIKRRADAGASVGP